MMNDLLDNLVTQPEVLNKIIRKIRSSDLFGIKDTRKLLSEKTLRDHLSLFLNQLTKMQGFETHLNWHEALKNLVGSETEWEALRTWLQKGLGEDKSKLTISLLIQTLGERRGDWYRLKFMMDELFLEHRQDLEQFLAETFKSLSFNSD
jgi:hypothetical protein